MEIERRIGALPYLLGGVVLVAALALATYLGYTQSLRELQERVSRVAREVLVRTDDVSEQSNRAFATLVRQRAAQPCSEANIDFMRRLALDARALPMVGYVAHDRLLCSSYGNHGAGLPVGPPSYLSGLGNQLRIDVRLPFASPETRYVMSTHQASGYSVLILPEQAIDVKGLGPGIEYGVFGWSSKNVMFHHGNSPELTRWLRIPAGESREFVFHDQGRLVVVLRSQHYDAGAFAAVPLAEMYPEWRRFSWMLMPLALVAGLSLAALIVMLARWRLSLRYQLQRALQRNELYLVYQPIVDLRTRRWVGAEALVRWRRPDGQQISPDQFIPLAERSDLIVRLTARVMDLFIRDMREVLARHPGFHVSLNFSARDLDGPVSVERLLARVHEAGISPAGVTVEVTERALIRPEQVQQNIRKLHAQGIRVAIDDFGTGYSSLSYLTELELDILKIDKSFVDTIGTDAATKNVVAHVIEIAKSLGLEMIAEGVETEAQAHYLSSHGVQYAQGWLYARPLGSTDLAQALGGTGLTATVAGVQLAAA